MEGLLLCQEKDERGMRRDEVYLNLESALRTPHLDEPHRVDELGDMTASGRVLSSMLSVLRYNRMNQFGVNVEADENVLRKEGLNGCGHIRSKSTSTGIKGEDIRDPKLQTRQRAEGHPTQIVSLTDGQKRFTPSVSL